MRCASHPHIPDLPCLLNLLTMQHASLQQQAGVICTCTPCLVLCWLIHSLCDGHRVCPADTKLGADGAGQDSTEYCSSGLHLPGEDVSSRALTSVTQIQHTAASWVGNFTHDLPQALLCQWWVLLQPLQSQSCQCTVHPASADTDAAPLAACCSEGHCHRTLFAAWQLLHAITWPVTWSAPWYCELAPSESSPPEFAKPHCTIACWCLLLTSMKVSS